MKIRMLETRSPQGRISWTIQSKTGWMKWDWFGTFYSKESADQEFNNLLAKGFCKDFVIREGEAPEAS
jgi:hypothetical protein